MRLAFYRGRRSWRDRLVAWWTGGPFSHVELVVTESEGSFLCYSASPIDGGVRYRWMRLPARDWVIVDLDHRFCPVRAISWFSERMGAQYDLVGVLGRAFGFVPGRHDRYFCSEAVASALGFSEAWRYCPNTLYSVVRGIQ